MPEPAVSVTVVNEQALAVDEPRIAGVARKAVAGRAAGELSVLLVDEERMSRLNSEWMGEDGPTDVLAFPIDGAGGGAPGGPPRMIGEVIVCPEVARRQAEVSFEEEMDLLVAHGVLHLIGFDHDTEPAAEKMRAAETEVIGRPGARAH